MRRVTLAFASLVTVSLALGGCSQPAPELEARGSTDSLIVGGTTADVKGYEGMIQTENDETGPWCGATLIAADWAVTAAHCVIAELPGSGFQRAVLGRQLSKGADGESIKIDQVIRHEGYDETQNTNDIALLHLATKSTKKPVRLATKAEWPKLATAGTDVTVIGWGATSEGGQQSNTLLQVTVPIVSLSTCNQQYQGIIDERQVCAGLAQGGKDSCQGDSGGPLFEKVDGVNVQVGVVSFGNGCARAGFAGVYTAVASFRDWIATNTKNAVPETATTAPAPVTTDAGAPPAPPAPDTTGNQGSSEDTGSAAPDPTPVGAQPSTTSDDTEEASDEEDDRPAKKKKSSAASASTEDLPPAQRVSNCTTSGVGGSGSSGHAMLLGIALLGLGLRRRKARKILGIRE